MDFAKSCWIDRLRWPGFPCGRCRFPFRVPTSSTRLEWRRYARVRFRRDLKELRLAIFFLEEIRAYRVTKLAGTGLEPIFPLWGIPTDKLALTMMEGGLRARLTCMDPRKLPVEFAGREWDAVLLRALPAGVDPCGENGEFHTFAYAGPMFRSQIAIKNGQRVEREGFVYSDMTAEDAAPMDEPTRERDPQSL